MRRTVVLLATIVASSAWADGQGPTLQYGHFQHVQTVGVGWALSDFWVSPHGTWELAAHPEVQVNRHRISADVGPDSLTQAGASAILRARLAGGEWRPYAEIGLGGNLFSRVHLGDKELSTAFQFSEHLGLGLEWHRAGQAAGGWVGWRISHYSNAGIGEHNDSLNTNTIVVGLNF